MVQRETRLPRPAQSGQRRPDRIQLNLDEAPSARDAGWILNLQRLAGNRAVQGLIPRPAAGAALQRKLAVDDPAARPAGAPPGETNAAIVNGYITSLSPDFMVNAAGEVNSTSAVCADPAAAAAPETSRCLCDMHALPDTWTIRVDDDAWPHTFEPGKTVTVHSPYSGMQFGAWGQGPAAHRIQQENWRVLGHELCGHAWLMVRGLHPSGPPPAHGGRPSHDATVTIENRIAAEHGIPASELRGLFADPHHGESFARVEVAGFSRNSAHISDLPASAHRQLDIAEAFAGTSGVPVKMDVIGHADQSGSDASNAAISLRRARRVKQELVSRGVASRRFLTVRGAGASECAAPGDQPDCRNASIFMFLQEGASETHV